MKTFTDWHQQSEAELRNDAEQVRRIMAQLPERRARPRCTHTAENMMRMDENDFACPACSPERFAAMLASAPDVSQEDA